MSNVQTFTGTAGDIELDLDRVNIEALRANLKDAEIQFHGRTGIQKLVALAIENGVEVDEEDETVGNVIGQDYRKKYGKDQNCGDEVVAAFRSAVEGETEADRDDALRAVADANGQNYDRWSHLNIGMRRMNLGNVLRGMIKRGEAVTIGSQTWEAREIDDEDVASAL